jgi:hypothetical protein
MNNHFNLQHPQRDAKHQSCHAMMLCHRGRSSHEFQNIITPSTSGSSAVQELDPEDEDIAIL